MTNAESSSPGFLPFQRVENGRYGVEMLVPSYLRPLLVAEDQRRAADKQQAQIAAEASKEDSKAVSKTDTEQLEQSRREHRAAFAASKIAHQKARDKGQVSIYSVAEVKALLGKLGTTTGDSERVAQCKALYEKMLGLGGYRPMAQPVRQWNTQLDQLAQTYPNFQQVVDYLRAEFTLRKSARQPLGFAPFAVHGAPGIGKSVFLEALRALLQCDFQRVQAETSQHAASLVGTAKHWGNSEVGAVFDRLVTGAHANPLLYVDEIDKTSGSGAITTALYGLLEAQSAKNFADASQPEIVLDASHIQWVFSANDIHQVPGPIRSRWVEFKIPAMKPLEARRVVESIYEKLLKDYAVKGMQALSDADLDALSARSPREMLSLLRQSIAKAILTKSQKLEIGQHLKSNHAAEIDDAEKPTERWVVVSDSDYNTLVDVGRVLH